MRDGSLGNDKYISKRSNVTVGSKVLYEQFVHFDIFDVLNKNTFESDKQKSRYRTILTN